jgi:hypothetical protein
MVIEELVEPKKWSDVVKYEIDSSFCRDIILLEFGSGTLKKLTLLGKTKNNNKYVPFNKDATDGSELAKAILFNDVDTSISDVEAVALVRGPAIVDLEQLLLVNDLDENNKNTIINKLSELLIKLINK